MILRVIPSRAMGTNPAMSRKSRLEATIPGAASQTILKIGGTFCREVIRLCQLCLIGSSTSTVAAFICNSHSCRPDFDSINTVMLSTLNTTPHQGEGPLESLVNV